MGSGNESMFKRSSQMTKMAAIPIYDKNILLRNPKANDLEIWFAASGA